MYFVELHPISYDATFEDLTVIWDDDCAKIKVKNRVEVYLHFLPLPSQHVIGGTFFIVVFWNMTPCRCIVLLTDTASCLTQQV